MSQPKTSYTKRFTFTIASSSVRHDHRYSEEQRTMATQLSRPREMHTLMRSEVSRPHRRGPGPTVRLHRPTGTRHPSSPPRQHHNRGNRGPREGAVQASTGERWSASSRTTAPTSPEACLCLPSCLDASPDLL